MPGRAETIETLQRHSDAIRAFGATSLYLFGSAARDEMREDSDVDLFIDYDRASRFDLFALLGIKLYLADVLEREVDVTTRGGLHPRLKDDIERSSIRVF